MQLLVEAGLLLLDAPQAALGGAQAAPQLLQLPRQRAIGRLQLRQVLGILLWKHKGEERRGEQHKEKQDRNYTSNLAVPRH